ncbi:hypothetical protein F4859DRAFT_338070 [Xylaria cf. heliscus]|nr:hypothetical protein F4859DRAFT_338070 [Xylaria cf. heliscus]
MSSVMLTTPLFHCVSSVARNWGADAVFFFFFFFFLQFQIHGLRCKSGRRIEELALSKRGLELGSVQGKTLYSSRFSVPQHGPKCS